MEEGSAWGIATIIGPLLLLALLAWAIIRNRQSNVSKKVSDDATREVYRKEEQVREDDDEAAGR